MPRKSKLQQEGDHTHDEQWQQAWDSPEALGAGQKQALLDSVHRSIGRRKRRQLFFIGMSAAAAILVALFIKMPGSSLKVNSVQWRELASNDTARKILLADGTELWLAPHSTVQVHPDFLQQRVTVLSKGTVYYSVAKDAQHPFSITINHQQITVLGTAFTIRKLDSVDLQLTVKEGKVALQNAGGQQFLTAGQQVITAAAVSGTVQTIHPAVADWWLRQQVRLQHIPLEDLLDRVESFYQVKLKYGKINKKMKVAITWNLKVSLEKNLAVLNALTGFNIH